MYILEWLLIPFGYLVGSIPFAVIIGYIAVKKDLTQEGAGHVSATAVYRHAGFGYFALNVLLDVGKGVAAVYLAKLLTINNWIILSVGVAVVIGHCWSFYIRFRGGLGASVIYGVLLSLFPIPFLIGGAIGIIFFLVTKRSTLTTFLIVTLVAVAVFVQTLDLINAVYPLILIIVQFAKRYHARKLTPQTEYKNDFYKDFKRLR